MAPKKKQTTKQNSKPKTTSSGPRLQISAENENRVRRLLLNSGRSATPAAPVDESLSKAQKTKKLKAVYEKLSCEGFTNDQIELALSALKVNMILYLFNFKPVWTPVNNNSLYSNNRSLQF